MIQPINISFSDWADSLFIDFPVDNIPTLLEEDDWQEYGSALITCESFIENGCPDPNYFDDKMEWANKLYLIMENTQ